MPSTSVSSTIEIHGKPLSLELARTPSEQAQGLSGRTSFDSDQGMLFVFAATGTYPFWMKDMYIPLDLIWIQDRKIIGIERNLPPPAPGQMPVTVYPPFSVNAVLELAAGGTDRYQLKIGDVLTSLP